jgi:transcriptional regulator with XRE-family HTH domain
MPGRERSDDRARRRTQESLAGLGQELRRARLAHDLSQREVARTIGASHSTWGRLERGRAPGVSAMTLARALSVVGLELSLRAYPTGQPLRDVAHLELLGRLRALLGEGVRWAPEVPLPTPGDLRAWDGLISIERIRVGVEAETRVRDVQAQERRLALKHRDGRVDHVILLLADTRHHRRVLADHAAHLAAAFPVPGRLCVQRLAASRDPGGSSIVLL